MNNKLKAFLRKAKEDGYTVACTKENAHNFNENCIIIPDGFVSSKDVYLLPARSNPPVKIKFTGGQYEQ